MAIPIAGRVVTITGASSGIGAALARELARRGAKLVLGARRMDKLEAVAAQCRIAAGQSAAMPEGARAGREAGWKVGAVAVPCDVTKRTDVDNLIATAIARFGRLDVMVANAGYGFLAKIQDVTDAEFDDIVAVNIKGTLYAMQAAAAVMRQKRAGHIVVISSAAARRGLPLYGVYSMTKAAQLSLAEAMRVELRDSGIHISTVHPITTATEFFEVASQRSRIKSQGLGKPQSAELVARKIARLIANPKPELWPHRASRWALAFAALFPRLVDRAMARTLPRRNAG